MTKSESLTMAGARSTNCPPPPLPPPPGDVRGWAGSSAKGRDGLGVSGFSGQGGPPGAWAEEWVKGGNPSAGHLEV